MEQVAVVIAWIVITLICLIISPFFTLSVIFFYANMPIISLIFFICGMINFVRRFINFLNRY